MHMERSVKFPAGGFYSPAQKHICFYATMLHTNCPTSTLTWDIYPDRGLQVALASIHTNNRLQGMQNNFEATATHLPPLTEF